MKLALHGFLPGLNASPGYREQSLRNEAGHRCYLAVAYNDWDMIGLCDEVFTGEGGIIRSCVFWEAESMREGRGIFGRGCFLGERNGRK